MSSQDASPSFPRRKNARHSTNISSWWWLLSSDTSEDTEYQPSGERNWCPTRSVHLYWHCFFFFFLIFHTLSFFFFPLRDSPISKSVISGSPFKADFSLCTKDQAEFWSQDTKDQVSLDLAQLFVGVWFLRELWHFVHNDQGLGLNLRHEFSHELNEEVGNFSSGSEKERVMSWSMRKLRRDERAWRMWIPYL